MTRLTEIAMQLVEVRSCSVMKAHSKLMIIIQHDTQLVSILYRTHKALTSTTAKISSLYAFDALCRAARSQVVKKGLTSDSNSEKGNEATFLSKVEGVLEGLVQDMISTGSTEAKVSAATDLLNPCRSVVGFIACLPCI
jgi:protein NRD1